MASARSITVTLKANVAGFKAAMKDAAKTSDDMAYRFDKAGNGIITNGGRMVRSAEVNREAWNTAGTAITAFGVAGVAALGLSAKAAIDWESAWAGVVKTVDGSADQLAQIEDGLRGMALALPASQAEIADTAALLGQLGIQADSIVPLTKVMIDLGEATNLTAEQAATTLARMANIFGSTTDDVARMGATIVDLGNNSATTESEITDLALRLAAAGKQAGLSESDVLAMASALTSVGVEAEAGGTAMSKVTIAISDAVKSGSDDLNILAEAAGMTRDQFVRAYEEDAPSAIAAFVEGMGAMSNAGESTTAIFEELGLTDQRLMRAVNSLGSAQGLLTEQIELASDAFASNTALVEEAEKRYDTTAAKVEIARNALNEAAISIGDNLLPVVATLAEAVAGAAEAFSMLPDPVQNALIGLGGTASLAALAGGSFLLLFPRVMDTVSAFERLSGQFPKVATGLKGIGKAGGAAALATVALTALVAATEAIPGANRRAALSVAETTKALLEMSDAGGELEGVFDFSDDVFGLTGNVESLTDAAQRITSPSLINRLQDVGGTLRGIFGQGDTGRTQAIEQIDTLGQSLASLVQSGQAELAAEQFEALAAEWEAGGGSLEELRDLMPAYTDALADADNQAKLATDSTSSMVDAQDELVTQTGLTQEALAEWRDAVVDADAAFVDLLGVYDSAIQKNVDLAQSTADATEDASDSWEDYYDGVSVSSDEYIAQLQAQVDAQTDWEENMLAITQRVNEGMTGDMAEAGNAMIDELLTLGPEGAAQVALLKDMSDEEFAKVVELWSQKGTDAVTEFTDKVESYRHPEIEVEADTTPASLEVDGWARVVAGRTVTIPVRTSFSGVTTNPGGAIARAGGGPITGPGTSTSDSIPLLASDGEYMQRAAAHSFYGTAAMDAMNRLDTKGLYRALAAKGLASGGPVAGTFATPAVNVSTQLGPVSARMDSSDIAALGNYIMTAQSKGTHAALAQLEREARLADRMGG